MRFHIFGIDSEENASKRISHEDWSDYHMVWQKIYCNDPEKIRFRVIKCIYGSQHKHDKADVRRCPDWNSIAESCPSIEIEDIRLFEEWQCVRMSATDLVYLKLLISY